jgi:hypothetical protein
MEQATGRVGVQRRADAKKPSAGPVSPRLMWIILRQRTKEMEMNAANGSVAGGVEAIRRQLAERQ